MIIDCVFEHNGNDTLLFASNFPGAFTRGENLEIATAKMSDEVKSYLKWKGDIIPNEISVRIIQDAPSTLQIADADSDCIFESEKGPITLAEYAKLKALALKSAADLLALFEAIPDKSKELLKKRSTFYGNIPTTADEIYNHTKNVNEYYFGEIGVIASNDGDILSIREQGFFELEKRLEEYLENPTFDGSYGEIWSLKKVFRRFIWHDRIHAKALFRAATRVFDKDAIPNPFCFNEN